MDRINKAINKRREKMFKEGPNQNDLINSRIKRSLTLRKEKMDELFFKKRFQTNDSQMSIEILIDEANDEVEYYTAIQKENYGNSQVNIKEYAQLINSEDKRKILHGLLAIRKILSHPIDPPIQEVVDSGIALRVLYLFRICYEFSSMVQYELLWIITNLASGESHFCIYLYNHGLLDVLSLNMRMTDSIQMVDQYVWIISNMAAEDFIYIRRQMFSMDFLELIIKFSKMQINEKMYSNCMWAISNLIRGIKEVNEFGLKKVEEIIEISETCCKFIKMNKLLHKENVNRCPDIVNSLGYSISILATLTENNPLILKLVRQNEIVENLIVLLDEEELIDNKLIYQCLLRFLGNFSASDDISTCAIVDKGIVPKLIKIIKFEKSRFIRKESCWMLSNITAGMQEHVNLFFSNEDYLKTLFEVLDKDSKDIKREALWCVVNLTCTSTREHLYTLIKYKFLSIINDWMLEDDEKIICVCLEAIQNILQFSVSNKDKNLKSRINSEIQQLDLINKIEELEMSESDLVSKKAGFFLKTFYNEYGNNIMNVEDNLNYSPFLSENYNNPSELNEYGVIINSLSIELSMPEDERFVSLYNLNDSSNENDCSNDKMDF